MCAVVSFAKNRAYDAFTATFLSLLKKETFESISTSDIIRLSGYSRGSFYHYFQDKYDLAQQLTEHSAVEYIDTIVAALIRYNTIVDKGERLYHIALDTFFHVNKHQDFYRLIMDSRIPTFSLDFFCEKALGYFRENDLFQVIIPAEELDLEFYYHSTTWQFIQYIRFWIKQNFSSTPEEMALQVRKQMEWNLPGDVIVVKESNQDMMCR